MTEDELIWKDFESKLCAKYFIDTDTLYKIMAFAFNETIYTLICEKQYSLLLNFKAHEIEKAIRRVKPKLNQLDELQKLRVKYPETADNSNKPVDTPFPRKFNGVWKQ